MANVILSAFTEEQAARLSKVSASQLAYWDRTDFFKPGLADENRRLKFSRNYTFQDIVGLRAIGTLINDYGVSVRYLRKVREHLRKPQDVWASTTLYIFGKKVYLEEPSSENFREPVSGQMSLRHLPLQRVVDNVRADILQLQQRRVDKTEIVSSDRFIQRNAPVIAGTRVPLSTIKAYVDEGFTQEDILSEFPSLTRSDINNALEVLRQGAA